MATILRNNPVVNLFLGKPHEPILPPAIGGIDKRVSKVFSPYKMEQGQDFNPRQFYLDVHGTEKALAYDNRTVYAKFQSEFDEIADLEEAQNQVMVAQRADDSEENQALYDGLQEQIDDKTKELKEKIRTDFGNFLADNLGPRRQHLIPEISYRFSRKALTTFIRQVNEHTRKNFGGIFTDGHSQESCILIIPKDPKGAVQIDASTRGIFQSFIGEKNPEKVVRPVELIGHAVYTIGLNGKTTADVDFLLKDIT